MNRARIELLREMGASDFPELELTEPFLAPVIPLIVADANEMVARRLDVRAARAALEQARAAAGVQNLAARPDLNVTYGYKRTQLPVLYAWFFDKELAASRLPSRGRHY